MKRFILVAYLPIILAAITLAGPQTEPQKKNDEGSRVKLEARVDPRVELMSLIFRLAGNPEYNQPNGESPYTDDTERQFGPFREHPVVMMAKDLRNRNSVSYDAVMSIALHIEDIETFAERIPFDQSPERLDGRWPVDRSREFLKLARDFVEKSDFRGFFEDHEELYEEVTARMERLLDKRDYVKWFDGYFGARPGATFHVIVGMLNGPCNYGSGIRFPGGTEEITPVMGTWKFDKDGIPIFDDSIVGTIVHEFCHTYTNPFVDRYAAQLQPAGTRIFPRVSKIMKSQAYGNWKTMMYESFVRSCVVRYTASEDGADAATRAIRHEQGRGFYWIEEMSEVLAEFEESRDRYPTFDDFMPQIIEFFNNYASRYEELSEDTPKVVWMNPPNGGDDVNPDLTEIKVHFSIPMKDKCWAVCGGGDNFPELPSPCFYDEECKVLTIPVKLKPDWSYRLWLNVGEYMSFQSRDGVPLPSTEVTFRTRKK